MPAHPSVSGFLLLAAGLVVVACADQQPLDVQAVPEAPALARKQFTPIPSDPTPPRVAEWVEAANARLAEAGSDARVSDVWLFTVGRGTDPYRRLRSGARWVWNPVYYLDTADFTSDLASGDVETALEAAFDRWSQVPASMIQPQRITQTAVANPDIFDGPPATDCIDLTADVWTTFPEFLPVADIVVGGWMTGTWFEECFELSNILGVTVSLSYGDGNRDHYTDRLYVEQFYNDEFEWVTAGAQFLGSTIDLESIAVHENGHALGLGHIGGIGKVPPGLGPSLNFDMIFSPQAVMNPGYLGGEKRDLHSIDEAGLRTLY
jgi:hypothetical protein